MNTFGDEKRKNDERRRFPWWIVLLVIGFAVGVFVTLLVVPSSSETVTYISGDNSLTYNADGSLIDPIFVTATYIIQRETATVQANKLATQQAQSPQSGDEAIYATATAIVVQATATQAAILTANAGS